LNTRTPDSRRLVRSVGDSGLISPRLGEETDLIPPDRQIQNFILDVSGCESFAPAAFRSLYNTTELKGLMSKPAVSSFLMFVVLVLFICPCVLAQSPPTFGQPTISGIQGVGFEQDLRLDPSNPNIVYTSVPGSLSSDTSWIWRSEDGGKTFKWVTAGITKTGKPNPCAGGGDTELAVDTGGSVYFNDLTLVNFSTARSDDAGATFPCSNTGVPDAAVDRQWYAVDGDPKTWNGLGDGAGHTMYLVNDEIGPGAVTCPVSGAVNNVLAMYRSPIPGFVAAAGIQFGPGKKVSAASSCDEGIMGNNEVSPVATRTDQNGNPTLSTAVKHVFVIHDDATFSRILIGRCYPVAFTSDPSGLNCVDLPVATLGTIPSGGTCPTAKTGGNFPTIAIDKAGNRSEEHTSELQSLLPF
jgi:hypothetical protein